MRERAENPASQVTPNLWSKEFMALREVARSRFCKIAEGREGGHDRLSMSRQLVFPGRTAAQDRR
jgi:hypothetical protein